MGLPIVLVKLLFDARFPSHTDWSETLVWFILYWYGWLFMNDRTLLRESASQATGWLVVGIAGFGLLGLAFWKGLLMRWLGQPAYTWDYLLYQIVAGLNTWAWVLAITGFFLRCLNYGHRYLRYLGPATLPFYILHQTAILTLGSLVVQTGWTLAGKFAVIAVGSLLATIAIYELLIRRSAVLRRVFGMNTNTLQDYQRA